MWVGTLREEDARAAQSSERQEGTQVCKEEGTSLGCDTVPTICTGLVPCRRQVDHMHQLEHPPANC